MQNCPDPRKAFGRRYGPGQIITRQQHDATRKETRRVSDTPFHAAVRPNVEGQSYARLCPVGEDR